MREVPLDNLGSVGVEHRHLLLSRVQIAADDHPPGSNGGTHRGPDLKPRLFIPSVLIMAFTDEGEVAREPGKHRSGAAGRKRARARHALTLNTVTALQRMGVKAAEGDEVAMNQLLRTLGLTHDVLQPTPHEGREGQPRADPLEPAALRPEGRPQGPAGFSRGGLRGGAALAGDKS